MKHGSVLMPVFLRLTVGVLVGAIVGVHTVSLMPGRYLQLFFSAFLFYVAVRMLVGFSVRPSRPLPGNAGLVAAGGVIGAFSVFVGIGGGTLTVPYLNWCGVDAHRAVGTSAALGFPIALWGALMYVVTGYGLPDLPAGSLGFLYLPAFFGITLTSAIFARMGAFLSYRISANWLRRLFAVLLFLVSSNLFWRNLWS